MCTKSEKYYLRQYCMNSWRQDPRSKHEYLDKEAGYLSTVWHPWVLMVLWGYFYGRLLKSCFTKLPVPFPFTKKHAFFLGSNSRQPCGGLRTEIVYGLQSRVTAFLFQSWSHFSWFNPQWSFESTTYIWSANCNVREWRNYQCSNTFTSRSWAKNVIGLDLSDLK